MSARSNAVAVNAQQLMQQQSTPPPSPSRVAAFTMSDSDAGESDAQHSDDSDYVPGKSRTTNARPKAPRKRLRQSSSSTSRSSKNEQRHKASKHKRKRRTRDDSADDDDDDTAATGDSDSADVDPLDVIDRSDSPTGGKVTGSRKSKRDAKNWLDDGCAATFAARIAAFRRAVDQSKRDGTTSFYNRPHAITVASTGTTAAVAVAAAIDDDNDDALDDSEYHDDDVAVFEDEPSDEVTATNAAYAPDDVTQTDSGLTVPTFIYAQLFPHQRECLEWLHHLHERNTGGILGDEMGLGKTVQIAAFLGALHHAQRVRTVLLLCPASVLLQWVRELHKWYPPLRVVLLHASGSGVTHAGRTYSELLQEVLHPIGNGDHESGGVVLSTYENVRQYQELFMDVEWDYVVLDEGHRIRNPDAEITLVCKQFRTVHRIILTGTPIQNRLRELWSLFDFVYPGKLGTLPTFDDEFVLPIRAGGYANASKMQVLMAYKCAVALKDVIAPYLLRRTKREIQHVTPMPAKMEQILFCSLAPAQRRAYATYLQSREVAAVLRRDVKPFRAITILRHICNHPDLLATVGGASDSAAAPTFSTRSVDIDNDAEETYGSPARSGKLLVLEQILALWKQQRHRVLLFAQTRKMLDILESLMAQRGYCFCRLDGTTSVKERQALLDAFNAPDSLIFVFLLTTRAGGIGVNLTGADRVVVYDPDWNPSTDLQARERSWRLGQTKPVTIYRLITTGTIEEKIYHRQLFKQYLTSKVLHDAKRKRCFAKHSLRDLFVLGDDTDASASSETTDHFVGGTVDVPGRLLEGGDSVTATDKDGEVDSVENDHKSPADKATDASGDNDAILRRLFDGDGLRSVFNHDAVECDGVQNQEADLVEIESTKIAQSALSALRASCALVRQQRESVFTPTWTGRSGVAGDPMQRTGGGSRFGNRVARGHQSSAASSSARLLSAAAAGTGTGSNGQRRRTNASSTGSRNPFVRPALSSRDMLAKIQLRKSGVGPTAGASSGFMTPSEMAKQLHAFLTLAASDPERRDGVTTEDLLDAFAAAIAPKDKLVFRNLLRDMADCRGRKWTLKREFVTGA